MDYKDYYKILGVSKNATDKEIKSAFRKLAQQFHPDKNPGDKRAEEKFKEINEANEVLSDPQKRVKYDQLGRSYSQWERTGRPGGGFDFTQWANQSGGRTYSGDLNDLFGGGMSDFFTSIFGAAGAAGFRETAGRGRTALRGEDVEQAIDISLEEAYSGGKRVLQKDGRKLEVVIPAGARTGTKVRLKGEGGEGQTPGDLFLVVNVLPHPQFKREGDDLQVDVAVDVYTAILGGEVRVPTLAGDVLLNLPPETQGGRSFRLAEKGMPKLRTNGQFGDLYAKITLRLPTPISESERKLFKELAALRGKK